MPLNGPLWENVTSFTEPEVHNVIRLSIEEDQATAKGTCRKNDEDRSYGSGDIRAGGQTEIQTQTDTQTDMVVTVLRSFIGAE